MSIGKRTVLVSCQGQPLKIEGKATTADIKGGMLLSTSASGFAKQATAATAFGQMPIVADKNYLTNKDIDDAHALNENITAFQPKSGERYNVMVVTGQALTKGKALSRSATAGALKIALTDGTEEIVCYADEVVTTTATQLVTVYFK